MIIPCEGCIELAAALRAGGYNVEPIDFADDNDPRHHYCVECGNSCDCGSESEEDCMTCEALCQYGG